MVELHCGDANAMRTHMFAITHPSLGSGIAEHVGEGPDPVLIAVAGKLSQGDDRNVYVAVMHPTQSVSSHRRLEREIIESGDLDVQPSKVVHLMKRHSLVDPNPHEHLWLLNDPDGHSRCRVPLRIGEIYLIKYLNKTQRRGMQGFLAAPAPPQ